MHGSGRGTVLGTAAYNSPKQAQAQPLDGHPVATKYKTDGDPSSGVARTWPLCPYPQVARYQGSGSIDDAANFACRMP